MGRAPRQHRPPPLNIAAAAGRGAAGAGGTQQGAGGRMRPARGCSPHGAARTRAGTGPRSGPVNSAVRARSRRGFVCTGVWGVQFPAVVHSCGVWRERYYVFSSACTCRGVWGERYSEFPSEVAGVSGVSSAVEFCMAVQTRAVQWLQYGGIHGFVYMEEAAGRPTMQPVLPCALLRSMILLGASREARLGWTSTRAVNMPAPRAFRSI